MENSFVSLPEKALDPTPSVSSLAVGTFRNPGFNQGTYEPKGETSLVLPNGWQAGCLDNGTLIRYTPSGAERYGTYNKKGPRKSDADHIKPEILQITAVQPYLDPARTEPPDNAMTGFKLYGTICYWMMQTVAAKPGQSVSFKARAHAWSRMSEDPEKDAAKYSHGIGYGPYKALEGTPGLSNAQRNYHFVVGIDPYGGRDPFASSVVWGQGAHIYNVFDDVPQVKTTSKADQITIFMMADCLYGMVNSNSFWSRPALTIQDVVETPTEPAVNYVVVVGVLPQDATWDQVQPIMQGMVAKRGTVVFSYDDAKRLVKPGLVGSKVILYGPIERHPVGIVEWMAPCAVEIKPFPKGETTPPTPPVVKYKRPKSMAGLHMEVVGAHTGYGEFLKKCADAGRPIGLVKAFYDGGALGQAKSVSQDTITVWRGRPSYCDEDNPPGDWNWNPAETPKIVKRWMDGLVDRWKLDRGVTDYLEIINEPNGATDEQFANMRDFVQGCMEYAEAHDFKLAIYGFSSGCPNEHQAKILLPTFDYAARHGHVLAIHDGSVDPDRRLFREAAEDGTALRHRLIKRLMDQAGLQMPPVVITECYWPDGYRGRNPYSDMAWYLTELAKDDYVLGMAWFTLGDYSFGGGAVNVVGQLTKFADCIVSLPMSPSGES